MIESARDLFLLWMMMRDSALDLSDLSPREGVSCCWSSRSGMQLGPAGEGDKVRSSREEGQVPELVEGELSICETGVPLLPLESALLRMPSSIPNAEAKVLLRIFLTCAWPCPSLGEPLGVPGLATDVLLRERTRLEMLASDSVLDVDRFRTRLVSL